MNLIIQPEAELDIEEAYLWYEEKNRGLGSEFVRSVDASLSQIQRNPFAYPTVHQRIHRKLIRRFPYGIFYIIEDDTIQVIACFHIRRNPKQWQRRI